MWVLVSAIPPLLWAFNNLSDEYLAKHHFARHGLFLVLISAAFEVLPGVFGLFLVGDALQVPIRDALILGCLGFWLSLSFFPYILALQESNANNAVPIFQTIPVFVFILGWVFLGEGATSIQVFSGLLIITAAIGISWDYEERSINLRSLGLMALSSLMIAVYLLATRYYTFDYKPLAMMVWLWLGSGVLSMACILLWPSWRRHTLVIFTRPKKSMVFVFFFQICSQIVAGGVWIKALAMAPSAALMETIGGLQPAYVLILSIFAGRMFPAYFNRQKIDSSICFKAFLIVAMLFGVYLISH